MSYLCLIREAWKQGQAGSNFQNWHSAERVHLFWEDLSEVMYLWLLNIREERFPLSFPSFICFYHFYYQRHPSYFLNTIKKNQKPKTTRETSNQGSFRYLVKRRYMTLVVYGLCHVLLPALEKEAGLKITELYFFFFKEYLICSCFYFSPSVFVSFPLSWVT